MNLFISWSGSSSRKIAEELRDWIPKVLPAVQPWVSTKDIRKGSRWSVELGKQLKDTNFGILVVTPDNVDERWLNWEAGALGKYMDEANVAPLLFGLGPEEVEGPLSQYQMTVFAQDDFSQLLQDLNSQVGQDSIPKAQLDLAILGHWWFLESAIKKIPLGSVEEIEQAGYVQVSEEVAEILDDVEDDILKFVAELPETKDRDWIDVDDVKKEFDLRTTVAEYHLDRLTELGYLDESEDGTVWFLSAEGRKYVVEEGLLDY